MEHATSAQPAGARRRHGHDRRSGPGDVSRTGRIARRMRTAVRVLATFVVVRTLMTRHALPDLVGALGRSARPRGGRHHPAGLGRTVAAVLRIGPLRARCPVTSLVLYRLLRGGGYQPGLGIGVPREAASPMAPPL